MTSYQQAWCDLETIRLAVERTTSNHGPAMVDHSIRLVQALLAEKLGHPDRVTAELAARAFGG